MANTTFDDRSLAASGLRKPRLVAWLRDLLAIRRPAVIDRETANHLLGLDDDLLSRHGYFWTVERPRTRRF